MKKCVNTHKFVMEMWNIAENCLEKMQKYAQTRSENVGKLHILRSNYMQKLHPIGYNLMQNGPNCSVSGIKSYTRTAIIWSFYNVNFVILIRFEWIEQNETDTFAAFRLRCLQLAINCSGRCKYGLGRAVVCKSSQVRVQVSVDVNRDVRDVMDVTTRIYRVK